MRKATWALLVALALCGCSTTVGDDPSDPHAGHDHGDPSEPADESHSHATEGPCTAASWQALFPHLEQCALSGAALDGANLRRAQLSLADLSDAHAAGVDLFNASLEGATLIRADLSGANLTAADLSDANFADADLRGARMTNATLTGASFEGVKTDSTTICVTGQPGPCW